MKAIVEQLELGKNNFSKWIHLVLAAVSAVAFFTSVNAAGNQKWIFAACTLLFTAVYWATIKYKIVTEQEGFTVFNLIKPKTVLWKDITAISYEVVKSGQAFELKLKIFYNTPQKKCEFSVKQFNKQKMQRFFEMLNEQCAGAAKNEHFLKQVTGEMNWKDQLKMY